jgi:hypothetical protein
MKGPAMVHPRVRCIQNKTTTTRWRPKATLAWRKHGESVTKPAIHNGPSINVLFGTGRYCFTF